MMSEMMEKELLEPTDTTVKPELLVSAVLHLMSHYSVATEEAGCTRLASVIERHLKALAELPDGAASDLPPIVRAMAGVVERSMPRPPRSGFLARFINSTC